MEEAAVGAETSTDASFPRDFFVSYTGVDEQWAEWIAWTLENSGYSVTLPSWDFIPGSNFLGEMHRAISKSKQIVPVLSAAYANSPFTKPVPKN